MSKKFKKQTSFFGNEFFNKLAQDNFNNCIPEKNVLPTVLTYKTPALGKTGTVVKFLLFTSPKFIETPQ